MKIRKSLYIASVFCCMALGLSAADTLTLGKVKSSVFVPLEGGGRIECNVVSDWPIGCTTALSNSVTRWSLSALNLVVDDVKGSGTQHTPMSVVENRFVESAMAEAKRAQELKTGKVINLTLDFTMTRIFETTSAVTFCVDAPRYGVSGVAAEPVVYASFLKSDGQQLEWTNLVLRKSKPKFCKLLAEELYSFFGVNSFANMKMKTTLPTNATAESFPFPKNPPALTPDGLRINYEPGEIAPAEMGRPTTTIPYSKVRKYLSASALKWLK